MLTKHKFPDDIKALFIEINFRKCKWLLCVLYPPPSQSDQYFFHNLDKALDVYSNYETVLITGDFNAQEGEKCKKYFDTLDVNKITDKKAFWKNIQPLFSEKRKFANKITLEDSEENILSDDTLVSEKLDTFFQNAIKTLNINENFYIVDSSSSITDPVDEAINTYKNHPSILLIKQKLENVDHFSFKVVCISEIEKELRE